MQNQTEPIFMDSNLLRYDPSLMKATSKRRRVIKIKYLGLIILTCGELNVGKAFSNSYPQLKRLE